MLLKLWPSELDDWTNRMHAHDAKPRRSREQCGSGAIHCNRQTTRTILAEDCCCSDDGGVSVKLGQMTTALLSATHA